MELGMEEVRKKIGLLPHLAGESEAA